MKRSRIIGVAFASIFAIIALAAATMATTATAALPEILPTPTAAEPILFTGKGGKGELLTLNGKSVKCLKNVVKGDATSLKLGTLSELKFEECTAEAGGITVNCTALL